MSLLSLTDIHKSFGTTVILQGANLDIEPRDRVALIGKNGAGKTTLIEIAAGVNDGDQGVRNLKRGTKVGYIKQDRTAQKDITVWQEARSAFLYVDELQQKLTELTELLATLTKEEPDAELIAAYEQAQHEFEKADGYSVDTNVRRVLSGLSFDASFYDKMTSELSGGQRTRLQLARLLLEAPDLLILDEPTNYLDMTTSQWLESYLDSFTGALLVVSHDRYFLDRTTAITYELMDGKTTRYPGNYSVYVQLREQRDRQLQEAYQKQQETIEKLEDFIAKNLVRASTTKRAQSRRKVLEKMDRINAPKTEKSSFLQFPILVSSGREVLELQQFAVTFSGQALFDAISVHVRRHEHVALLGDNGTGKTSLLRALRGEVDHTGKVRFGTNVQVAYFAQEQVIDHPERTVLESLWSAYPTRTETEIRTHLGHLLFRAEDVYKPVGALSGGERSRLFLAHMSYTGANFLLLDEPTNHLDLSTKEVLEEALLAFEGTILFVSHDRYFINRIATRVIELTAHGLLDYDGNYDDYIRIKRDRETSDHAEQSAQPTAKTEAQEGRQKRKQTKMAIKQRRDRFTRVEQIIETMEAEKTVLEETLASQDTYADPENASTLTAKYAQIQESLQQLYEEWSILVEQLEDDDQETVTN